MSLGVNLLTRLTQKVAAALDADWDIEVIEAHHRMKVDAPSGTAKLLGEAAAKGSTEPMRLDLHNNGDPRYREGLVIGHNPTATPRAGSCIFAHLWRTPGEPTAGCTAMAAETMDGMLAWLRPDARPVFVLLPRAEYERLAQDWRLPERAP